MIIYEIRNIITDRRYIGQTRQKDPQKRRRYHYWTLNKNIHVNEYLQHSWNKYGQSKFEFNVIDSANSLEELNKKEQQWIEKYRSINLSYNMTIGGDVREFTEETLQKLRISSTKAMECKRRPIPDLISPDGTVYTNLIGLSEFCRIHNLRRARLRKVINGDQHEHRGWKLKDPVLKDPEINRKYKSSGPRPRKKIVETSKNYKITDNTGKIYQTSNLKEFARNMSIPYQSLTFLKRTQTRNSKNLKGWTVEQI
jgi:group I intron endonuclease